MPEELKPCPFCGGKVDCVHTNHLDMHRRTYHYVCRKCNTTVFIDAVSKYKSAEEIDKEAIKKWNRRADND